VLGALSVATLVVGALALMVRSDRLGPLVGAIGLGATLVLVLGLVLRNSGVLPWAVALAGAEYAAFLAIREGSIDGWAPVYGAGLLLVSELAYWAIETPVRGPSGEGLTFRRTTLVVCACVAAGGVGGLILAMAELSVRGGLWLEALGIAAGGRLDRAARPACRCVDRFRLMAQVLPAEGGLRRIIGDGEGVPDGEVEGLTDHDLIELYRGMVLMRTYDERSVVYHRQGRIGTYAIYLEPRGDAGRLGLRTLRRRLDLPSYRESAIGCCAGCRPRRSSPGGAAIRPAGGTRRTTTSRRSASRSARTSRTRRARLGEEAEGRERLRDRLLRGRGDLRGRFPRGRQLRRRHARAAHPLLQQQPVGDLDAALAQTAAPSLATRPSATGCRACASTGWTSSPCSRRRVTRSRAARAARAVLHRGGLVPRRPHATADDPRAYIDLDRVEEEKKRECVGRYEGYLRAPGC
jgi:pyruvate dehydrogenase E1 component alpha subunit